MQIKRLAQIGPIKEFLRSFALNPEGSILAGGFGDGQICLWSSINGRVLGAMAHIAEYAQVTDLAFSPDGKLLASASDDASIRLWDVATQREVMRLAQQRPNDDDQDGLEQWDHFLPLTVAFSPDGTLLAGGQLGGGIIKLWDVRSGQERATLAGHTELLMPLPYPQFAPAKERDSLPRPGHVVALKFTKDSQKLLSASHDNTIGIWDLDTMQGNRISSPNTYAVNTLAVHPSQSYFVSGGSVLVGFEEKVQPKAVIHSWHLSDLQQFSSLTISYPFIEDVVFTADGTFLISTDARGQILWWDTANWTNSGKVKTITPYITGLLTNSDNRYLWSGGYWTNRLRSLIEIWQILKT